jgi:hypothetical protein
LKCRHFIESAPEFYITDRTHSDPKVTLAARLGADAIPERTDSFDLVITIGATAGVRATSTRVDCHHQKMVSETGL